MNYDPHSVRKFADEMAEIPERELAEKFSRLNPAVREGYLAQVRACARCDALTNKKKSLIWGSERRLSAIHKAMTDAGR